MKILLVEDDYMQAEFLSLELRSEFPEVKLQIIDSEFNFRESIPEIEKDPPTVVLIDIMLKWTSPAPNIIEPPEDIREAGFYEAGFRCQEILSNNPNTKHLPIILYSVLAKADLEERLRKLPKNVTHLMKEQDGDKLFEVLRKHLKGT